VVRRQVEARAKRRCEYCGLSSLGQAATFHVDHIVPIVAGGLGTLANLALACVNCSLRKGARQAALDPNSRCMEPIFHPRKELWNHHFRWSGTKIIGITPTGRATIAALGLNSHDHCYIRTFETRLGRHPPPGHV
jgi:hypothetical protein